MPETYQVICKCDQCDSVISIDVPKGQRKEMATKQECPNCGIKGEIRLLNA